jgi:hypothetical protein
MTKFKVGDQVRLISNTTDSINKIGDVGIIVEITKIGCRVKVKGNFNSSNWSPFKDLELVELEGRK